MLDSEDQFNFKQQDFEETLKTNERFASRYFELLERFGDLPACDKLILTQLKEEFSPQFLASLEFFWDEKSSNESQEDFDDKSTGDEIPLEDIKADSLPPEMALLRQLELRARKIGNAFLQNIFDWCNIQIVMPKDEPGLQSLRVMFFLNRALGNFNAAMEALVGREMATCMVILKRIDGYMERLIKLLTWLQVALKGNMLAELMENRVQQMKIIQKLVAEQVDDCNKLRGLEERF